MWIFLGVFTIGLYLGVISMHFRVFSKCQSREWGIFFGVAKISNIFGVLEIPDIFGGLTVDTGPKLTYEEKMRVPPLASTVVHLVMSVRGSMCPHILQ